MKLDEWKALYIRTYRAYEVSKPDADTRYRLDAILDHLHSIKPTPASQDADSPSIPDSPKASFTPMQALYEAPLVTDASTKSVTPTAVQQTPSYCHEALQPESQLFSPCTHSQ
jgi:hypothetical protein